MDGSEPGTPQVCPETPEWWAENPWAKAIQESTSYQARPSKAQQSSSYQARPSEDVVSATVQQIFEVAKVRAHQVHDEKMHARRQEVQELKASLPHRYRNAKIQVQLASGKLHTVKLADDCMCPHDIQRNGIDGTDVHFYKFKLTIPGNPEPLGDFQDLRDLLPDHPVLQIILSDDYGSNSSGVLSDIYDLED